MADKYLNLTAVQTLKAWIEGKFALDADLDTLSDRVEEIIAEGGEPNVIEAVKVNGTALTPDANKAVDVPVPEVAKSGSGEAEKVTVTSGQNSYDMPTVDAMEAYVSEHGGVIQKVKVAGTELPIDSTDKSVNIPAATTSADGAMSAADKTKLEGIEAGAEANVQSDWNQATTTADDFIKNKPTKLSDFTNDGDGTQGSTFPTTDEVEDLISQSVASAYKYKGSVATVADLPASGNTPGDVYDVQATGMNYAWNGTAWDALGQYVDTSVLWTSVTGQSNTLEAATVSEINAILNPTTP